MRDSRLWRAVLPAACVVWALSVMDIADMPNPLADPGCSVDQCVKPLGWYHPPP